jgi:hypothetical protein
LRWKAARRAGFHVFGWTNRPWRIKSRAPSLACQALEQMIVGLIADVIASGSVTS